MKVLFTTAIGLLLASNAKAIEVAIDDNYSCKNQCEIPVKVDITYKMLTINITNTIGMDMVVTNFDGIVFQKTVTTKNVESILIDLDKYSSGNYAIYFTDSKGNHYEGEFEIH